MEQSRRRLVRIALIGLAIAAAGAGTAALARRPHAPDKVEGHLFAIPSAEDRVLVEVFNATPRKGLARTATRVLRQQGLDVIFLGNADTAADSTRIYLRRGDSTAARRVQRALGFGHIVAAPDSLRRVDVSVVLGPDYQPVLPLHP
ncbi:MAG TPA: LytR C-terminal domain-containing protein [Gemmatimonadales bacterium]|nr:LytR C-terminal domain-containing protein [Gemmatimonadales bacterium]